MSARLAALRRRLAAFWREQRATVSVEAVIVLPVLIWTLGATHVFWDGFRTSTSAVKAAYTISDLLSRQRSAIGQEHLDGMRTLLDVVASRGPSEEIDPNARGSIRVSVARARIDSQTAGADGEVAYETTLVLDWSRVAGDALSPAADVEAIRAHVPPLAPGDQLLVVETAAPWTPPFGDVLPGRTMTGVAITRHRFGQRLCWEAC